MYSLSIEQLETLVQKCLMNGKESFLNNGLVKELTSQEKFTGVLEVQSPANQSWKLYFCLNRLIWADGGVHPNRSWRRQLGSHFPQLNPEATAIVEAKELECWNYYILRVLLKRNLIEQKQVKVLIESKIAEVFFDIMFHEAREKLQYTFKPKSADWLLQSGLKVSSIVFPIEQILKLSQKNWNQWSQKGLKDFSPNMAPIVKYPQKLREEVNKIVYKNFIRLFNGKRTLRDLAVQRNQDLQRLTYSLSPYLDKGLLSLVEVPDLPDQLPVVNSSRVNRMGGREQPQIVCIDDSSQILQIMNQIISKAGYRFIGINDALRAVPTLVAANPNLIFLDLNMPNLNGYEICAQIRRVSKLQAIPVVILTGQNGIVDRMRSKLVGASDFLAKPVNIDKVRSMVNKYVESEDEEIAFFQSPIQA